MSPVTRSHLSQINNFSDKRASVHLWQAMCHQNQQRVTTGDNVTDRTISHWDAENRVTWLGDKRVTDYQRGA